MAVTFDATSVISGQAVTSVSWSHTTSGADRGLVIGVSISANIAVTSSTYAAAALANVGVRNGSAAIRSEMWKKSAPASGANTAVVNLASATDVIAGAVSANNVDQVDVVGPYASNAGTASPGTVDVTSAAGELVVDCIANNDVNVDTTLTVGAGQTQRWNMANGAVAGAGSTEPGAATVTMSWTVSSSTIDWSISGASFIAAAAGGGSSDQLSNYLEYQF